MSECRKGGAHRGSPIHSSPLTPLDNPQNSHLLSTYHVKIFEPVLQDDLVFAKYADFPPVPWYKRWWRRLARYRHSLCCDECYEKRHFDELG